jgi:hypothetical protein
MAILRDFGGVFGMVLRQLSVGEWIYGQQC